MKRQRMIRSLPKVMMAIIIMGSVFLCVTALPETGFSAWQIVDKPQSSTDYPSSVDPYEVIVYEHANFVGDYRRFKLLSGMRHVLVPVLPTGMNDKISSIQVGSKVAVMVFRDANFGGGGALMGIRGVAILYNSQKVLDSSLNDLISSLIVFPKELIQSLGVMLVDHRSTGVGDSLRGQFFPLPEFLNQTEARYATIPGMNDDANEVQVYPYDPKSPAYGKVQVTLYGDPNFKGRWLTLPGADRSIPPYGRFMLNSYQFDDSASSLVVRWVGQPPSGTPAGSSTTRVTAPSAPETTATPSDRTPPPPSGVPTPNVSGQWKSSIGLTYNVTQQQDRFQWTVMNSNEKGEGVLQGNNISASWKGAQGSGSSAGKISAVDSSGKATQIEWNNGVRFFR